MAICTMLKLCFFIKNLYYKYVSSFLVLANTNENINDLESPSFPFKMSMQKEFLKMSFSLVLLLTFLFTSVWLFKKFLKSKGNIFNKSSLIKIVDKKNLSQKSSLYIVKVANKILILSESTSGIQPISELPEETNFKDLTCQNINNTKKSSSNDIILRSLKKLKGSLLNKEG